MFNFEFDEKKSYIIPQDNTLKFINSTKHKNILYYELYILLLYYALFIIPLFFDQIPSSAIGRLSMGLFFVVSLTACKVLISSNIYGIIFLVIVFFYRLINFTDQNFLHELVYVGKGNYLNITYGPFIMLLSNEWPELW